jgi:hypothetical protein
MTISDLVRFSSGTRIKITTLGVDAYLSIMRLGINCSETGLDGESSFEVNEDFTFVKSFDPNNRQALTDGLETWIEESKKVAVERFFRRLSPTSEPSPVALVEEAKVTDISTKRKYTKKNPEPQPEATVAAPSNPEVPQTPTAVTAEEPVKVEPQAASTIAAKQAETVSAPVVAQPEIVKYEKSNKDHARLVQGWLDQADSTWKRDARSVEWCRNQLIPAIHGVLEILIDGKENVLAKSKLISAFTQKDLALLK